MNKLSETLQSRKFWLSTGMMVFSVIMFSMGQIDVERMMSIIQLAAGVYVGALSIEDAAKRLLDRNNGQ